MKLLKKVLVFTLASLLLFGLCGCEDGTNDNNLEDTSKLTMYVGSGNTGNDCLYYDLLHQMIKDDLGIDVDFVWYQTMDTTNLVNFTIKNQDLPADIICVGAATPTKYQKDAFLDLSSYSDICSKFQFTKVTEATIDDAVYQLPFCSKLIGVLYNKTLLEEFNFEVPKTMQDMVALKTITEGNGYSFAKAPCAATGHGFNYLMHLMGSEWFTTLEGTEWLNAYLKGETTIDEFVKHCDYFKEYAELGLYGDMISDSWDAFSLAAKERCAVCYALTSSYNGYSGFMYEDGSDPYSIVGANKDENGDIVYQEDANGNVVLVDDIPVLYDSNNADHASLTRYNIGDVRILNDEWAAMPWPNESGDGSYAFYDNLLISLNKDLANPGQEQKLADALKILDYLTTDAAADLYKSFSNAPDAYVAVNTFNIDETRNYKDFKEEINAGYTMPWYYLKFDNNTIVAAGQCINDYLCGTGSYEDIFTTLDEYNKLRLNDKVNGVVTFEEQLDYEDVAKLWAATAGTLMQDAVSYAGVDALVSVALVPYMEELGDIPVAKRIPIVQSKAYAQEYSISDLSTLLITNMIDVIVYDMTGAEINELLENGYDYISTLDGSSPALTLKSYEKAEDFSSYPYVMMTKNELEIDDNSSYYVAIPKQVLTEKFINEHKLDERIVTGADGEVVVGTLYINNANTFDTCGISMYLKNHPTINTTNIIWD